MRVLTLNALKRTWAKVSAPISPPESDSAARLDDGSQARCNTWGVPLPVIGTPLALQPNSLLEMSAKHLLRDSGTES
jgi:hypothetical protein